MKKLEVRLGDSVLFDKNMSGNNAPFVPIDEDKAEGRGSVMLIKIEHLMKKS